MSNSVYASLTRQQGLSIEMQKLANNLANANTTGYKSDRAIFSEFIVGTGSETDSVSMGRLVGESLNLDQGSLRFTGGRFDVAIQGEGFFQLETERGPRLTRAGHFQPSPEGLLIDPNGYRVLSTGGGPITIPEDATEISIGADGTISADGNLIDQIGVVETDGRLLKDADTLFIAEAGTQPSEAPRMLQGALEQSNVSPVLEITRLIEVQRAYEAGQTMLERDDQRVSQLIDTLRSQ